MEHTYTLHSSVLYYLNNSTSLIDHFIVSDSIHKKISEYYTNDSVDNLSDHIPLFINFQCIVESVPSNPRPVMHSKPVWGLAQPDHIQKYQDKLNELLYNFLPTDEMFISSVNDSLCLKKKHITEFHDNIISASYIAMQKHIPYSQKSKTKVIPGWDVEMDTARDKSKFWHSIWSECGREHTGIVYDIMKKARSWYHYLLRALKKKKHYKTKLSISKSMLRSDRTCYWKASRAIRKNISNCTNVVDGLYLKTNMNVYLTV